MFRCVYLSVFVALLSGFAHADVLLSESFPTSPSIMDETEAPSVAPTTPDSASTVTDSTTDFWTNSATSSSPLETSAPAEPADNTDAPTVQPASTTIHVPTTQPANTTTPSPTNATTPFPTNATTPFPTNATTPFPTNATTPFPTNATTPFPTNATTVMPTNASTTAVPTTPPLPPNPTVGEYSVRSDPKSSACLKANMGLQFRYMLGASFHTINLVPNITNASGFCGSNGTDSTLTLKSEMITIHFLFVNQSNKFHLSAMNFTLTNASGAGFTGGNNNLSLWEASLGSSYMCRKEQTFNITDHLVMNTFELQVQPFGLTEDKFSTAHECSMDDTSLLIPIIVGAALAGLILIVVIAYVIGRRKTYVGYQTL